MTYRLVSRELQDRLDEISGGDFTRQFDAVASTETDAFSRPRAITFELEHKTRVLISIEVTPDMVEKAYDPHAWNDFPEVTPPYDVWMRVEHEDKDGCYRDAGYFWGQWRDSEGRPITVDRFRPWDEEKDKE